MRGVTDQCLEPPANGLGVGRRSTGKLGLREQVIVDVHGLLHPDDYAVSRWQKQPYLDGFVRRSRTASGRPIAAARRRDPSLHREGGLRDTVAGTGARMGVIRRRLPLIGPRRVRRVECLFDTGASSSFIRPELVRRLRLSTASLPRSLRIRLGKRSTPVSQLAAVMIRLDGATLADAAYVMPGLTEEYVVGAEFLERHNIRLDPKRRRLVLPARSRLALILV